MWTTSCKYAAAYWGLVFQQAFHPQHPVLVQCLVQYCENNVEYVRRWKCMNVNFIAGFTATSPDLKATALPLMYFNLNNVCDPVYFFFVTANAALLPYPPFHIMPLRDRNIISRRQGGDQAGGTSRWTDNKEHKQLQGLWTNMRGKPMLQSRLHKKTRRVPEQQKLPFSFLLFKASGKTTAEGRAQLLRVCTIKHWTYPTSWNNTVSRW